MTIKEKMESVGAHTSGFDYLRIFLALAILTWHSIWLSGENNLNGRIASGDFQFIHNCLVPCFFALSGFLVSGSLLRNTIPQFITLRIIRIVPALAVEVLICAIILGGIFTSFPLRQYFSHPEFRAYFLNIVGDIHYTLPGVFEHSPAGPKINIQLWTIPFELWCYVALVFLSILGLIKRRVIFLSLVVSASFLITLFGVLGANVYEHDDPGKAVVLCFLVGVCIYLYRDRIPYSNFIGALSIVGLVVSCDIYHAQYLMSFPIAYAIVWIGLMRPPAIPFGDLSYGVYLFHIPVERVVMTLLPHIKTWYVLTSISAPVTLVIAWLSWNLVEYPILSKKKPITAFVERIFEVIFFRKSV